MLNQKLHTRDSENTTGFGNVPKLGQRIDCRRDLFDHCPEESRNLPYWEWDGPPPNPAYYRPDWKPEEATWWQLYETVTEGTPVTPAFATQQELVDYLVEHGDFWDQHRRAEGNSIMRCTP